MYLKFFLILVPLSLFFQPVMSQEDEEMPFSGSHSSEIDNYFKQQDSLFEKYISQKNHMLDSFIQQKQIEFDEYRRKKNEEFAAYIGRPWQPYNQQKGVPAPKKPDPVKPTISPQKDYNKPIEIPHGNVIPKISPKKEKPLDIPLTRPSARPTSSNISLFYTPVHVSMDCRLKFKMEGVGEKEISQLWTCLSSDDYTPMFEDCARICQELNLNGWATWNLCKAVGEKLLGKETNEAVVMQTYLMAELGYDAQIARVGDRLVTICPADVALCRIDYLLKNNKKYYIWADIPAGSIVYSYQKNFASATRVMDFSGSTSILLNEQTGEPRTFKSKMDNQPSVTVKVRKSLMECYKEMPLINDWSFYACQPMDTDIKRQIGPALENAISGKSEREAANILLHFVQTAFNYKTDDDQYGYEKTDFKEEPFFYPACDCEDRSILYADLVRNFLGLDVILLHYPNHLCTAVKFKSQVNGHYVKIDGMQYVICDPTYIGSSVGSCMPKYQKEKATIYKTR